MRDFLCEENREPRFLLRRKWVQMALAAEFPAIPSSAVKIASERRCAILVHSAQSPNGKNINLHKKWGFRRFQKECQKVRKRAENHTFFVKSAQKVRFAALFGTLSGIGGNPTFCAD